MSTRKIVAVAVAAAGWLAAPSAQAQDQWPNRPITLIVPYAPGGYTDTVGRIAAQYLTKALGVTAVVENRTGAGGVIGSAAVARAEPNGYTLCVCSVGAITIAPVSQKVDYDPAKDFTAVSIISTIPQTVIVKPSLPVNSVAELIAYAKANPGKLNYGSAGTGSLMHYSVELFQFRTGTKMTHIPFRGGAPATTAVISGEVDLSFTNMSDALPQIEGKTVRAVAVTSSKRSSYAPELPTIAETLADFRAESWNGVLAPAKTPQAIVDRLAGVFAKMAEDREVQAAMAKVGASAVATTPAEFKAVIDGELKQWSTLVEEMKKNGN